MSQKPSKASAPNTGRRDLLKGLAAGSIASAAGLVAHPAGAASPTKRKAARSVDVLVVGSGVAGTCAALAAAERGASVLIVEKMPFAGGTTRKSGGVLWVPNNPWLQSQGIDDKRDDALRYMVRCAYPQSYDPTSPTLGAEQHEYDLIATFYDQGAAIMQQLMESTEFKIVPWRYWSEDLYPDYYATLPENKVPEGRSVVPDVSGHPDRIIWKGNGGSGDSLLWQLQAPFEKLSIETLLDHTVLALTKSATGRVDGVMVDSGEEAPQWLQARKGVVFCSGGFAHNVDMARQFLKGHIWGSCAAPGSTGDFVPMASEAGAALGNMNNAWWGQVPIERALQTRSVPATIWSTPGDSMIQVNRFGRRFVNEKVQYNERTQAHFYWDPVRAEYTNLLGFMIYDSRTAKHYAGYDPIAPADAELAHVIEGETLEALTANIAKRLAKLAKHTGGVTLDKDFLSNLSASIQRFSEMAKKGKDEEFQRGESPIEIAFQFYNLEKAPNEFPNMTMHPFEKKGPFYATILGAGALDTKGGAVIDTDARVLDSQRQPIPGLYAAGNCIAHPAAQAYWGGGGTLGPHMTFGYIAGRTAARGSA